jgi:hypothetical protein
MDGQMRVHRPLDSDDAVQTQADVEQIHVNGREYLVFPLIAAREMVLDYPENGTRELLPARHLQESVPLWEGTPICFVHPENERRTADDPREYTQTIIGQAYQPQIKDKEKLRVMAYIDVDKAEDIGGLAQQVVTKLKQNQKLGVSAGYATLNDDREGGNFNGTEYDVEQGYVIPDHIAIFPNDEFKARCDWEDGCGAPRVNYEVKQNELSEARRPTFDGLTSGAWDAPSFTDYAEEWYSRQDSSPPDNITVNTVAQRCLEWTARRTLVGDPNGETADEVVSFQVVNLDGELNENALTAARNLAFNSDAQESIMSVTADLLENAPENSGEWPSGASYNFNRENATGEQRTFPDHQKDKFEDESAAEERAAELGIDGTHEVENDDGETRYMPGDSHVEYEQALSCQRENRLTACEVQENYDLGRPESETIRTLINEYEQADDVDGFKDRLNGDEPLGVTDPEQVYAMLEEAPDRANERHPDGPLEQFEEGDLVEFQAMPEIWGRVEHVPGDGTVMVDLFEQGTHVVTLGIDDLNPAEGELTRPVQNIPGETEQYTLTRNGEYVVWDTGNTRQHGQVTAVADSGCLEVNGTERCAEAGDGTRIVKVQHYAQDGDVLDDASLKLVRRDGPNEGNLRSWNAPRSARVNSQVKFNQIEVEIGDRTIDIAPPEAVVNAAELALEKKDELDKSDCGTGVGEQRANQIVNGNLAPEDFLTRANGTAIPTYLDSHESDVDGIDQPPTQWSDEVWDGILSEGDSPRCGPVQYALWGGTATGTGLNWATGIRDELSDALDAADETLNTITVNYVTGDTTTDTMKLNLRSGQYVQWDWSGGTAYGQVDEIVEDGSRTVEGNTREVSADDEQNIAVIEQFSEDGEPQNQRVVKYVTPGDGSNEDNLREWDAPTTNQNTADEDPATLFQRFLSSIGFKANAEASAEELMDEVEDTVDTETESSDEDSVESDEPDSDATDTDDASDSEENVRQNAEDNGGASDDADSKHNTEPDDGDTSDDDTQQMKENQADELSLETIAAKTAFGISELEEMEDNMLRALERTVQEMSDAEAETEDEAVDEVSEAEAAGAPETAGMDEQNTVPGERANTEESQADSSDDSTENQTNTEQTTMDGNQSDDGTDDGGQEQQTVNTDQFLTTEEAEEQFASKEDVDDINENVEQIKGMVQNIQTEQENEQKEETARMVANAIDGMSVEAAKQLPEEELEDLAETHATRTNYAAVPGQRQQVTTNTQSDEDIEDYPAGGRSAYEQRSAEGGD